MSYVTPMYRPSRKANEKVNKRRIDGMLKRMDMKTKIIHGTEKQVWPDEKRVEAVNLFLQIGNMSEVARQTGIPVDTLRDWRKFAPWWKDLENILREEHDIGVAGELTGVVDSAIAAIADRVQRGDFVYNPRSGEVTRVPVSAANLNKIAGTMIDKKLTLQKQPTKYSSTTDNKAELENKLATLATAFSSFTSGIGGRAAKTAIEALREAEDAELVSIPTQDIVSPS